MAPPSMPSAISEASKSEASEFRTPATNAPEDKKALASRLAAKLAASALPTETSPLNPSDTLNPSEAFNPNDEPDDFFHALDAATATVDAAVKAQQKRHAAAISAKLTPSQIAGCFQGKFEPVSQAHSYGKTLIGTAGMMLLLPALFVLLVVIATIVMGWGLFTWMGSEPTGKLPNPFIVFGLIGLGLLLLAAWVPIFSMVFAVIATLFSGNRKSPETRTLTREEQPTMYEFVDQICKKLGAPAPSRIDLNCEFNASASFESGLLSFQNNDLVLTLGVPLIATQTADQLASVIAHEFGHFCQDTGMRVQYVLCNLNGWFMQSAIHKAYRDEVVAYAVSNSEAGSSVFGLLWAITYVIGYIGRYMMWWFAYAGHAISGNLSREMEFDADRYAIHLAGSKAFSDSQTLVQRYAVAYGVSISNLQMLYGQGILVDNIPRLVQHIGKTMPATTIDRIANATEKEQQDALDTHPPTRDRKQAAMALAKPGIVSVGRPAHDLIEQWTKLCENITLDFYSEVTGKKITTDNVTKLENILAAEHKLLLDKAD
ncbi:M48 family metallopeptidase [Planctomycetes bacterium CA13]